MLMCIYDLSHCFSCVMRPLPILVEMTNVLSFLFVSLLPVFRVFVTVPEVFRVLPDYTCSLSLLLICVFDSIFCWLLC